MKVFLTGASGLLGHAISAALNHSNHHVVSVWHKTPIHGSPEDIIELDLTAPHALEKALLKTQPDAIINAAALSAPADCERDPKRSEALNVTLPASLAKYAADHNVRLIHFSTDMVFDGQEGSYTPDSPTNPTNLYGKHKLASEIQLREICPSSCTLRLPLLMGNSPSGIRSVHEALWSMWQQNKVTPLFEDEWRMPVSVSNVAALSKELLSKPKVAGLFHWAGNTRINRWEMGTLIAEKLGVPISLLQKTRASAFPQFKDRPLNLTMDSSKLKALVQTEPVPFENQLEEIEIPPSF